MSRIAIVGSCITRDLWPIRGGGAEQLLYISRTSFPSLFSAPLGGFTPSPQLPGDLHQHEHNALLADIRKTALAALLAFRPTHIIFDFIDERFDLLSAGEALLLRSGEMARSGYLEVSALKRRRTIPRLSAACGRLWTEAAAEFATFVRATPLGRAQLILHSGRWATAHRDAAGHIRPFEGVEILAGDPADVGAYNDLLERQEAWFEAVMPPLAKIDAGPLRLGDSDHRWGLAPFHYVSEYYDEVRRQLVALGLVDAFSGPIAEPSAPGA